MTLEYYYQQSLKEVSDIQEHLPVLKRYASQCNSIVEFGVRHGVSTTALLLGLHYSSRLREGPHSLLLVDEVPRPETFQKLNDVKSPEVAMNYAWENSLYHYIPRPVDMIFLDTFHTTKQLWLELKRHAPKTKKWILLHDTQTYGKVNEEGSHGGLWPAIRRYCKYHPWKVKEVFQNCNGLTVLERRI